MNLLGLHTRVLDLHTWVNQSYIAEHPNTVFIITHERSTPVCPAQSMHSLSSHSPLPYKFVLPVQTWRRVSWIFLLQLPEPFKFYLHHKFWNILLFPMCYEPLFPLDGIVQLGGNNYTTLHSCFLFQPLFLFLINCSPRLEEDNIVE